MVTERFFYSYRSERAKCSKYRKNSKKALLDLPDRQHKITKGRDKIQVNWHEVYVCGKLKEYTFII